MTSGGTRSWRKMHRYAFGRYKVSSLFTAFIMLVIAPTGILLAQQDELRFIPNSRVSIPIRPNTYQQRLDQSRQQQCLTGVILIPAETSVPLTGLILDPHRGNFFRKMGAVI